MRLHASAISGLVAAPILLAAASALAAPLDPTAYPSLGVFSQSGAITIDYTNPAPLIRTSNATYQPRKVSQGAGLPSIYVFDFDSIAIGSNSAMTLISGQSASNTLAPIALLSRSTIAFSGVSTLSLNGGGGYLGSTSPSLTGNGPGGGTYSMFNAGGGGGYGGAGGAASDPSYGAGGPAYGNLYTALQGGSSGGNAGVGKIGAGNSTSGGGGGALELGAVGTVTFSTGTTLDVTGFAAASPASGGGSGGGLFVHGSTVIAAAGFNALAGGGVGAAGFSTAQATPGGGGGGGGRIAYQMSSYVAGSSLGNLSFAGGAGGAGGVVTGNGSTLPPGLPGDKGEMAMHVDTVTVPSGQLFDFDPSTPALAVADFQTTNVAVQTGGTAVWVGDYANPGFVSTQSGGVFSASGSITNAGTSNFAMGGGVIVAGGGIQLSDNATISGYGTVVGTISGTSAGASIVASGATLVVGNANSATGVNFDGTILVNSTASANAALQLQAANHAIIGNGAIGPFGKLQASNGITLSSNRTLSGAANSSISGAFTNLGTVAGPSTAGDYLTFVDDVDGTGAYTGNVKFSASFSPGIASPGNGTAAVALTNGAFVGTTHLEMQLAGVVAGSQYDQLDVSGILNLAGTLDVMLINGFFPAKGQSFALIVGDTASTFGTLNLPALTGGESWLVDATTDGFTISVVPEPMSGAMATVVIASLARRRRRGT